ncbi:MAG TPA: hypothetical protein PLL45_05480, partial [Thermoflexales bacterium]|nr:hypothetical protein [Thermoflexales bacterium]
ELFKALGTVYQIGTQIMTERQPPEVQVINALLSAKYPDETEKMLIQLRDTGADDRLTAVMGQLAEQLAQEDRSDTAAKLTSIMLQAGRILPKYDPDKDPGNETPPPGSGPTPPPEAPKKPMFEIARR